MELITINHLTKDFGRTPVLQDLSVSYSTGKVYGLVGENGAGKTTLFNCIIGMTDYQGEIRKKPDMSIGYLPAENFFYSLITGWEYLHFCIKAKGKAIDHEHMKALNEKFQLPLDRYASEYSTGMKKKLALMALLLQNNDLYILDEPFNGVDLYGCIQLKRIILSLKAENKTIILSSHLINTLQELCDNIDYLNRHTIVKRYTQLTTQEIEADILANF
ncbi:ABC transporter ATP-binding protein [uncultured Bacteroides sp.]|uniref:ATP-binding cassette domain-containing protein n=1 Tax=uncultured Bacteroides sp. TaxID=162156 RepID=UPI0026188DD9|nr:ABC transporter ATP-binding protein [uncultured Bacteroides sp.]